jgi:hypothetical protein
MVMRAHAAAKVRCMPAARARLPHTHTHTPPLCARAPPSPPPPRHLTPLSPQMQMAPSHLQSLESREVPPYAAQPYASTRLLLRPREPGCQQRQGILTPTDRPNSIQDHERERDSVCGDRGHRTTLVALFTGVCASVSERFSVCVCTRTRWL